MKCNAPLKCGRLCSKLVKSPSTRCHLHKTIKNYPACYICLCDIIPVNNAQLKCSDKGCTIHAHKECTRGLIKPKCPYCHSGLDLGLLSDKDKETINDRYSKHQEEIRIENDGLAYDMADEMIFNIIIGFIPEVETIFVRIDI